jgi:hypothetical protein
MQMVFTRNEQDHTATLMPLNSDNKCITLTGTALYNGQEYRVSYGCYPDPGTQTSLVARVQISLGVLGFQHPQIRMS